MSVKDWIARIPQIWSPPWICATSRLKRRPDLDPDGCAPLSYRRAHGAFPCSAKRRTSAETGHHPRHTRLTELLEAGTPVNVIWAISSHRSTAVLTSTYAHASDRWVRDALDRLTPASGRGR